MLKVDSRSFRHWFGGFTTGVAVITVKDGREKSTGITINSLTSVSLDPPLVLFCLEKKAHIFSLCKKASFFTINLLSDTQEEVSRHFANPLLYPAPKNIWADTPSGCPKESAILKRTLGWMVCKRSATYSAGDHVIFLGQTVALKKRTGASKPLVYFDSRYRKLVP